MLLFAVDDGQLLQKKDRHESDDHGDHQRPDLNAFAKRRFRHFRDQVEERHADDQPGRERHDVEEVALIAERKHASGESHQERRQGVDRWHAGSLLGSELRFSVSSTTGRVLYRMEKRPRNAALTPG